MPMSAKVAEALAIKTDSFQGPYQQQIRDLARQVHKNLCVMFAEWNIRKPDAVCIPMNLVDFNQDEQDSYQYLLKVLDFVISNQTSYDRVLECIPDSAKQLLESIYDESRRGVSIIDTVEILPEYSGHIGSLYHLAEVLTLQYGRVLQIAEAVSRIHTDPEDTAISWFKISILDWCHSYKSIARQAIIMLSIILQHSNLKDVDTRKIVSDIFKIFESNTCFLSNQQLEIRNECIEDLDSLKFYYLVQETQCVARAVRAAVNAVHASKYPDTWGVKIICKFVKQVYPGDEMVIAEKFARAMADKDGLFMTVPDKIDHSVRSRLILNYYCTSDVLEVESDA